VKFAYCLRKFSGDIDANPKLEVRLHAQDKRSRLTAMKLNGGSSWKKTDYSGPV